MNIDFNNNVFLQRQSMYLNFDKSTDKTLVDQSQIQYEYKMTGYFISADLSNGQPQYNENKIDYESNWIKITDKEIIQEKIKAKIITPSLNYDSVINIQVRAIDENNGQYSEISESKQCILIKNDRSNVIIDNINWNNKDVEIQLDYDIKSALPSNATQLSSDVLLSYRKKILENISFKIEYTYTINNITPDSFLYNTSFILTTSSAISPISLLTINNLNNNQNYYIWVQLTNNITGEKDLVYRLFLSKAPAFLIYKNGAGANLPQTNEFFPAKLLSNKSEISQQSFAIFDSSYDKDIPNEKPSIGFYSLPQQESWMGTLYCQKINDKTTLNFINNQNEDKYIFLTDKDPADVEEALNNIPTDYNIFKQNTNDSIQLINQTLQSHEEQIKGHEEQIKRHEEQIKNNSNSITTIEYSVSKNASDIYTIKNQIDNVETTQLTLGDDIPVLVTKIGHLCQIFINSEQYRIPPANAWNSSIILTLPLEYRPTTSLMYRMFGDSSDTYNNLGQNQYWIEINPNGNMYCHAREKPFVKAGPTFGWRFTATYIVP